MRWRYLGIVTGLWAGLAVAQGNLPQNQPGSGQTAQDQPAQKPGSPTSSQGSHSQGSQPSASELPPSDAPPRSSEDAASVDPGSADDRNFSSSRESIIDLSPPKDDLKEHPNSAAAVAKETEEENAEAAADDVQELHQWNPMKSLKDVEVGDYYFKRKNYRAALDRYKEALFYKDNDAVATFRLAVCQEQMADKDGALKNYLAYLKILPHGPFAGEAEAAIGRLGGELPKAVVQTAEPVKP